MSPALALAPLADRVTVRPLSDTRAIVSARLPHVNLAGIWANRDHAGRVTLSPPRVPGKDGREYPAFALQPGFAEQIAAAVATLWTLAEQEGRR
jgi:hypothetical protein